MAAIGSEETFTKPDDQETGGIDICIHAESIALLGGQILATWFYKVFCPNKNAIDYLCHSRPPLQAVILA
jgi:hypothetical protein